VYVFVASIRITSNALSFGKIGDRDMFINHSLLIFNGRDVRIIQTFDVSMSCFFRYTLPCALQNTLVAVKVYVLQRTI